MLRSAEGEGSRSARASISRHLQLGMPQSDEMLKQPPERHRSKHGRMKPTMARCWREAHGSSPDGPSTRHSACAGPLSAASQGLRAKAPSVASLASYFPMKCTSEPLCRSLPVAMACQRMGAHRVSFTIRRHHAAITPACCKPPEAARSPPGLENGPWSKPPPSPAPRTPSPSWPV